MYTRIKDGLYLVSQPLPKSAEVKLTAKSDKTNHIVIFDRSGSMSWTLRDLIEDIIRKVQTFRDGDTFTAGWFSSQGEFGWICKGLSLTENRDVIPAMLRKHNYTLGMTCYSEILKDTQQVVDDLSAISKNNAVCFFSDGFPNQGTSNISALCKVLAPKVSSALVVGYGTWYGRELMAEMAQNLGGILVHSSNLQEFSNSYASFTEGSETLQPRVEFKVPKEASKFISTIDENGDVITHSVEEKTLYLSPTTKHILYFTESEPSKVETCIDFEPFYYATARSASQFGDYNLAADLLGKVGDVRLIDMLTNSFTISEYGNVEAALLEAVQDSTKRFVNGQKDNYVPAEDQFCGLQLMEALVEDETAKLLVKHPEFSYKKISRATKPKNEALKLELPKDVGMAVSTLVWSSKMLNLSVGANVFGTLELDDKATGVGLDRLFKAKQYKNYTLIHDGKWNVTKLLPFTNLSDKTKQLLKEHDLIVSDVGGVTIVDPKRIPVINRKIASSYTDLDKVCDLLKKEASLEAKQKVYKEFFKRLPEHLQEQTKAFVSPSPYSPAQVEYLKDFGVNEKGEFSPESETLPVSDVIPVTTIEFAIEGFSSLPAIKKVEEKLADKKKLTVSEKAVFDAMEIYKSETAAMKTDEQKAVYLKQSTEQIRKDLFVLRSELNRVKFAVVLGKFNFTQKPKLENGNNDYVYNGTTYYIKLNRNAEVKI